ncbi:MAG: hypothetical protein HXN76_00925 [Prevotella pallens]|uniref:hypothetical protein n=1 Tax=Prevotella pallens TaxID=60133 RepID=UPI001CB4409F|nr:hypothetical protein [Prevotella pallens]MBF1489531.1 hypothetical protein [Prevotella pallens]MBF1491276.1 hypothetical protein [Prevotella pallens]MBF1493460.1 hypothetical protein [Prevotella pallens]
MIPSKQHTVLYSWKNLKLLLFFVLCNLAFCKSYAQYYSFKTNDFYENRNPKVVRKNKVYTSWADINGRRWYIKTDAGIKDYEYLKVGTTTDEAKYIILKTNLGIQKVKKLIVFVETSRSLKAYEAISAEILNPEIVANRSCDDNNSFSFSFENVENNDFLEIKIYFDTSVKTKSCIIIRSIEITNEIDQNEDNSTTITSNKGIENNIIQVTRTLSKNYWNTFCLPFNVDKDSVKLHLNNPELREFTGKVDGTTMLFKDATEIKAGIPYIIKPKKDVVNPIFRNVTITEVEPKTITDETGNYAFVGAYSPTELKTDGTELFLGDKDNLYKPSANDKKINGMRAFFRIKNASHAKQSQYNISLDGTTTIVLHNTNDIPSKTHARVYTLDGRQVYSTSNLKTGIYIKNGRKIYVN